MICQICGNHTAWRCDQCGTEYEGEIAVKATWQKDMITCRDLKPVHYTPEEVIEKSQASIAYLEQRIHEIQDEIIYFRIKIRNSHKHIIERRINENQNFDNQ